MINPFHAFLWRYRRQERDIKHLYETLRDFMTLSTSGEMLNFGYWNNGCRDPLEAQTELCRMMMDFSDLRSNQTLLDVGGGKNGPAILWRNWLNPINIITVDICDKSNASNLLNNNNVSYLQSSALTLPLKENSVDRIIALESAQHFNPIERFLTNAGRIMKKGGVLGIALPGITRNRLGLHDRKELGLLNITWASERYNLSSLPAIFESLGFHDIDIRFIGKNIYVPLADYYLSHREDIKKAIIPKYSSFVEYLVFKSMLDMKKIAQKHIIDYALIRASV